MNMEQPEHIAAEIISYFQRSQRFPRFDPAFVTVPNDTLVVFNISEMAVMPGYPKAVYLVFELQDNKYVLKVLRASRQIINTPIHMPPEIQSPWTWCRKVLDLLQPLQTDARSLLHRVDNIIATL